MIIIGLPTCTGSDSIFFLFSKCVFMSLTSTIVSVTLSLMSASSFRLLSRLASISSSASFFFLRSLLFSRLIC